MYKVKEDILVSSNPKKVYDVLVNIADYPSVFSFYETTERVNNKGENSVWKNRVLMKNGLFSTGGKLFEWHTEYILDAEYIIKTSELGPKFPLKQLNATWEVKSFDDITLLQLAHRFKISTFIGANLFLYPIVAKIIKINSNRLLQEIKKYTERAHFS